MLNTSFLALTKVIGPDSLYCGKWGKCRSHRDLDLDLTVRNIEHVRAISYTTICISVCMFLDQLCFRVIVQKHGQTDTHTHRLRRVLYMVNGTIIIVHLLCKLALFKLGWSFIRTIFSLAEVKNERYFYIQ